MVGSAQAFTTGLKVNTVNISFFLQLNFKNSFRLCHYWRQLSIATINLFSKVCKNFVQKNEFYFILLFSYNFAE